MVINNTKTKRNAILIIFSLFILLVSTPGVLSKIGVTTVYPSGNINATLNNLFNVTVNVSCTLSNCGDINVSIGLQSTSAFYNFSNCNMKGRTGPSQSMCDSNYSGTILQGGVSVVNGIQYWTVPKTGNYTIDVYGAGGGAPNGVVYAKGARMRGTFELAAGTQLKILVGQNGTYAYNISGNSCSSYTTGSGGGGTYVTYANNTPLIIAGGGGGYLSSDNNRTNGVTASGGVSGGSSGGAGGINGGGGGGAQGGSAGDGSTSGGTGSSCSYGPGGGGLLSDGGTNGCSHPNNRGLGFVNNGTGGQSLDGCLVGDGGFGGGGAAGHLPGGGGGYSGGGGNGAAAGGAGGGGSYNAGTNQDNSPGANAGSGKVIINSTVSSIPSSPSIPFYTNDSNPKTVNIGVNQSQLVTFFINATGSLSNFILYPFANLTSNLSNNNITSSFTVSIKDFGGPVLSVSSPTNISYPSNNITINFTATDSYLDSLWYFNGSINISYTRPINITLADGKYNFIFYSNDSSNNIASQQVSFTVNRSKLSITKVFPSGNWLNVSENKFFNLTFNLTCTQGNCGEVNVSLEKAQSTLYFSKSNDVSGEDCITPNVCLTRDNYDYFLYNSVQESSWGYWYLAKDTEWAVGDCSNKDSITFYTYDDFWSFYSAIGGYPEEVIVGQQLCLHLVSDNLYLNILFDSWSSYGSGGGFSYTRDVPSELINPILGSSPFYTNNSNPRTISLNYSQSQLVTFFVNATEDSYKTYSLFAFLNSTLDSLISNVTSIWNISILTPAKIDLAYPATEHYYPDINIINYSVSDRQQVSSCWFSNNSGTTNSTPVNPGTNFTNVISVEGLNQFTLYCNNTLNDLNSTSFYFVKDSTNPLVNFTDPTPRNGSGVYQSFISNISINELNLANITWNWAGTPYLMNVVNPFNLSKGLVSYYHFDESSWNGTYGEVKDVLGKNNATAENGVTVAAGRYGNSGSFNGDTNYINIADSPSLNNGNVTVSSWIKWTGGSSTYRGIVTKYNSDSSQYSYQLYLDNCDSAVFGIKTNIGSTASSQCSDTYISQNVWHHVVGSFNGTHIRIYVDGEKKETVAASGNILSSTVNVSVGQYSTPTSRKRFYGLIDEVMIYNRSLTDAEVKSLYSARLLNYPSENRQVLQSYEGDTQMNLENPDHGLYNWTLLVNQSGISSGVYYNFFANITDIVANKNFTITKTIKGSIPPSFVSVTQTPNIEDELDPGVEVTITSNLYDPDNNFDSAVFQWKNSSSVDWNTLTMSNVSVKGIYTLMNLTLTLPIYQDNLTYRLIANDTTGVERYSDNYTIANFWDCTWNVNPSLGEFVGWDENKFIENITINNTGDPQFGTNNCTLSYRLTYNLAERRIYFDDIYLKPSNTYILLAKSVLNVSINASFLSEIKQENGVITTNEVYGVSSNQSKNTTFALISNQAGPYMYQVITSYPSSIYLTPQNFSFNSYMRNLMGSASLNETNTAYNVTSNWILPSLFINTSGNINSSFENITDSDLHYNNINLSFTDVSSMTSGIKYFYLNSRGYNLSGGLIKNAINETSLLNQINITFVCYNVSDGVCVSSCSYLHDPDCAEPSSSTGGGGGGGGAGNNGKEEQSSASFELLSGKVQQFILPIENKYADPKENIRISVSGINSEYIKISPDTIARIDPRSSKNITVTITAPAYFSKGEYKLTFTIVGELNSNKTKELLTERKLVTLNIVELPKEDTDILINDSLKIIAEMNSSKMVLTEVLGLYAEIKNAYNKMDYAIVKNNYEKIREIRNAAFNSQSIINELNDKISKAELDGISVLETKKILYTSESAFARGDYSLALSRLNEAKLTFAIETKGEFNLLYVVKNNPVKSGASALGFALFAFAASLALRLSLYKKKLKALTEEEKLLLELMKVIQRECFTNNHMSMEEYEQAMSQYETRLSKAIEEKIEAEAKIANLMKIRGKKRALEDERKRLVELVKKIQDDYMNKGIIETRIYENMIKSYSARLAEVEEELTFFDAQEALSQNKWSRRILKVIGIR